MENSNNKTENKKNSKAVKIFLIVFVASLFFVLANYAYFKIQIKRGELVNYYGKWYTKEQLKKEFPPQYYDVPAKNTPEEVYAEFRQALLNNDIEKALILIREEDREEYRKILQENGTMEHWGKKLPEKITKESEIGNFAHYDIDMGTENKNTISFLKDENGYWKIDNI